ncbi:hypothetical protein SteCoe_13553 [Stentor coeruleus]|uniref:Uncharacterized protein n=1 Tax=Stentor coeruleus TaxID=5963 RepID=A0A1R2C829_9CILI|nr:hypothetical protein SteCoe_13553 [Stentor coeruleus]
MHKDNLLKPYRKSYNIKSHEEITGWREGSGNSSEVSKALQILKPYKVKSLAELHRSPKYPHYKPDKNSLPLISPSYSGSLLGGHRVLMTKPKISITEVYGPGIIYPSSQQNTLRLHKNHFSLSTKSSGSWLDLNSPKQIYEARKMESSLGISGQHAKCNSCSNTENILDEDALSDEMVRTMIEKSLETSKCENKSTEFPEIATKVELNEDKKSNLQSNPITSQIIYENQIKFSSKLLQNSQKVLQKFIPHHTNSKTPTAISTEKPKTPHNYLKSSRRTSNLNINSITKPKTPENNSKNLYTPTISSIPTEKPSESEISKDKTKPSSQNLRDFIEKYQNKPFYTTESDDSQQKTTTATLENYQQKTKDTNNIQNQGKSQRIILKKYKSAEMSFKSLTEKAINIVKQKEEPNKFNIQTEDCLAEELEPIEEEGFRNDSEIDTTSLNRKNASKKSTRILGLKTNSLKSYNEGQKKTEDSPTKNPQAEDVDKNKNSIEKRTARRTTQERSQIKHVTIIERKNIQEEDQNSEKSQESSNESSEEHSDSDEKYKKRPRKNTQGKIARLGTIAGKNSEGFQRKGTVKAGPNRMMTIKDPDSKAKPKINIIPPGDKSKKSRMKRTSTLLNEADLLSANIKNKRKKFRRTSTTLGKPLQFMKSKDASFIFEPHSAVDRFINNYSTSFLNKLHVLLLTLEEDLVNISNMQALDPNNLLPISSSNRNSQNFSQADKNIKKIMKIELELVLKPLNKKKGEEIKDNMISVAENIKKSIFSDGVKKDLITYAKDNKNTKRISVIEQGMSKIINKRMKVFKSCVASESSDESPDKVYSDGEDNKNLIYKETRSRNLRNIQYEMNLKSPIRSRKSFRSAGSEYEPNKEIIKDLEEISYLSEGFFIGDNDKDIASELYLMNWCNARNMKKFLFSSQVNFNNVNEEAINVIKQDDKEYIEDDIDIKNLESRMLKNRFYVLNNINTTNSNPIYQDPYALMMTNTEMLAPDELKRFEVETIRKYLRKLRYKKNRKRNFMRQMTFRSFTNLPKSKFDIS